MGKMNKSDSEKIDIRQNLNEIKLYIFKLEQLIIYLEKQDIYKKITNKLTDNIKQKQQEIQTYKTTLDNLFKNISILSLLEDQKLKKMKFQQQYEELNSRLKVFNQSLSKQIDKKKMNS